MICNVIQWTVLRIYRIIGMKTSNCWSSLCLLRSYWPPVMLANPRYSLSLQVMDTNEDLCHAMTHAVV
jgi:hypothetical protein